MYKEITKEVLESSSFLAEGTTCIIIRTEEGEAYKIYKQAIDYIKGSGIYNLELEYEKERLEFIVSHKDEIKNSRMPDAILSVDGKPVGVKIEYYDNCVTLLEYLQKNPEIDLDVVKNKLHDIVGEMIKYNIIPTDPNFENFMVRLDREEPEIVMVDVDDIYVDVYPPGKSEVFKESSIHACYNVIDLSFQSLTVQK